jgi:gliding motility-associated-like protein
LSASGSAITDSWVTASSIGSVFSPTVTAPATYTVYGLGSNGCANLSTVSVNVYNSQVVEAMATPSIICSGANAVLTVVGGTPTIASYQNEVVSPSVNSSYPITIVDVNGCLYDRTAYVNVTTDCLVQIYSGFTPNGDGINDNWQIGNIENYPDNKVYIVNRWGHKLFETTHYNNNSNTWNGMYNGAIVPSGTYFYVIELNGGKDVMKGWLEITGR